MKYIHIGWCKEGIHDKVWGIIELAKDVPVSDAWHFHTNKYLTFWGRRGAKLQTKLVNGSNYDMDQLFRKKTNKGYKEIEEWQLNEVYPEFQSDLEKTAFWATLKR
jgi:hypothetical protein